jgi:hypothetical protein
MQASHVMQQTSRASTAAKPNHPPAVQQFATPRGLAAQNSHWRIRRPAADDRLDGRDPGYIWIILGTAGSGCGVGSARSPTADIFGFSIWTAVPCTPSMEARSSLSLLTPRQYDQQVRNINAPVGLRDRPRMAGSLDPAEIHYRLLAERADGWRAGQRGPAPAGRPRGSGPGWPGRLPQAPLR